MGTGCDKAKLGRWTWARYRGKNGMVLRCVSVYRPVPNSTGASSVWNQHKRYLLSQNDDRDPQVAFWEDLRKEAQEWLREGDQLIIGGDINDEVRDPAVETFFSDLGMHNLIYEHHSPEWAEAMRTKRLSRSEAWCCVQSTIMKTLEYPLVATSLSHSDVDTIMPPILKVVLPKLGIQKKIPHSLLYGSASVQGCNLKDPWVTQLVEHLEAIMHHQYRDTPSADLHVKNMELTQCHVGSAAPFWELPFDLYGCLAPRSWMKSTWKHLDKTPLTLKGPKFTVSPKRARDDHLMDIFVQHDFDVETLRILNECRLCLHATMVADITEADGGVITQEAWEGKRTQWYSHN